MQNSMIKHETLVIQVMERIKELITSNEYKIGDKLPTENELAELFGTGLSSIREAIKIYNYLGILESKPAKGPFICSANDISSEAIAWSVMLGERESYELMEMREAMELTSIMKILYDSEEEPSIIKNCLKALRSELLVMKSAVESRNTEDIISSDYNFHKHILESSGVSVVVSLFNFLQSFTRKEIKVTYFDYVDDWSLLIEEHEGFVEALESRNEARIRDRVNDHFLLIKEKLRKAIESNESDE